MDLDNIVSSYADCKFDGKADEIMQREWELVHEHGIPYNHLTRYGSAVNKVYAAARYIKVARNGLNYRGVFTMQLSALGLDPGLCVLLQAQDCVWHFQSARDQITLTINNKELTHRLSPLNLRTIERNFNIMSRLASYSGYLLELAADPTFKRYYAAAKFSPISYGTKEMDVLLASISPEWAAYSNCKMLRLTDRVWGNIGRIKSVDKDLRDLMLELSMAERHYRTSTCPTALSTFSCRLEKEPSHDPL